MQVAQGSDAHVGFAEQLLHVDDPLAAGANDGDVDSPAGRWLFGPPPSTWRGTIVTAAAPRKKSRRVA